MKSKLKLKTELVTKIITVNKLESGLTRLISLIDFDYVRVYTETFNIRSLGNIDEHEKKLFHLVEFNFTNIILSWKVKS